MPPRDNVVKFLINLLCLAMIFLLPNLLASLYSERGFGHRDVQAYEKALVWVAVFYVSFYITTDPTSGRGRDRVKWALQNLLLVAAATFAFVAIMRFNVPAGDKPWVPHPRPHHHTGFVASIVLRDVTMTVLTIALSLALKFFYKLKAVERQRRESIARAREAELQQLKTQLNPHFLFNTLNSIYVLIELAPEKARSAVHQLSRMLRYMLYENHGNVTLDEEVLFLENYIDLMRLRLSPSTDLEFSVDMADAGKKTIAPLLFVNLIENAIKYGMRSPGRQYISISLKAEDDAVVCRTVNSYDRSAARDGHGGIGLSNLLRRLDLQYRGRYVFSSEAGELYTTTLRITLSTTDNGKNQMLRH